MKKYVRERGGDKKKKKEGLRDLKRIGGNGSVKEKGEQARNPR